MVNYKIIDCDSLIHNFNKFKNKKICAMVKADAYGHGQKTIVKLIENFVDGFGVVNVGEGIEVRKLTSKPILICARVHREDLKKCSKHKLEIFVDDEESLLQSVRANLADSLHLKINCGMNRFGVKSEIAAEMIDKILVENDIKLRSICTHFPCTESSKRTLENYQNFMRLRSKISQEAPICFGGSGIAKYPFQFDVLRLGIGMYGYGDSGLLPVMKICSYVSKTFYVDKGEFVGYGTKFRTKKPSKIAVVPVGYGDGLRRNLSGNFDVVIGGKKYHSVGNICMDAFFVLVDENVSEGDKVEVLTDANIFAEKLRTIPYEILTGFSNLRGKTIVETKKT